MLRVLLLIKGLGPGGAERLLVHQVRNRAADVAYEVAYLVPAKDQLVGELEAAGAPCACLGTGPRGIARLRRRLASGDVDVVHVHSPLVAAGARLAVRSIPAPRRPRLAYTEHNSWAQYRLPTRGLNRLTYGLDDWQVAVSDGVRATVAARHRGSVEVIVHGIDTAAVAAQRSARTAVRGEWGVDDATVVVGTVANLRVEKAYPDLLAAAELVLGRDGAAGRAVRFVAVGQGPLEAEVRAEIAARGLARDVELLGYRPDATRLMAGFDVFALSSRHEGLPVAVMEAQALGLPVVATAVGGVPEAVTDGVDGLLVPPGAPEALASAIGALVDDAERREALGAAARAAAHRFDAAASTAALERGYRRLVTDRSAPASGRSG